MAAGYRRILAALDFSEHADRAFAAAAELARREGAELTLLHVVAPVGPAVPRGEDGQPAPAPADDHALAEELRELMAKRYSCRAPEQDCSIALRRGHPSEEILAQLKEHPADLVVLGSQGLSGMGLVLLGSVAERVSRRSPCDCLVVKFDKPSAEG